MKKITAFSLIAALLVASAAVLLSTPTPAVADNGCPSGGGWFDVPLIFTLPDLTDIGNFHDQNGDGIVCARINPGQSKKNDFISWTVKDNTNPE